jgi:DNA polymerase III delta prime subunit
MKTVELEITPALFNTRILKFSLRCILEFCQRFRFKILLIESLPQILKYSNKNTSLQKQSMNRFVWAKLGTTSANTTDIMVAQFSWNKAITSFMTGLFLLV